MISQRFYHYNKKECFMRLPLLLTTVLILSGNAIAQSDLNTDVKVLSAEGPNPVKEAERSGHSEADLQDSTK